MKCNAKQWDAAVWLYLIIEVTCFAQGVFLSFKDPICLTTFYSNTFLLPSNVLNAGAQETT